MLLRTNLRLERSLKSMYWQRSSLKGLALVDDFLGKMSKALQQAGL